MIAPARDPARSPSPPAPRSPQRSARPASASPSASASSASPRPLVLPMSRSSAQLRRRSASSSSATRRSSGVVTLRFSAATGWIRTLPARRLDQHRLVGGRVATTLGSTASAARSASARKTCGVCAAQSSRAIERLLDHEPSICPSCGANARSSPLAACLIVSVTGAAAITPAASGVGGEGRDQLLDQLRRQQRPGRVVDRDQLGLDRLQGVGDRLGPGGAAGDDRRGRSPSASSLRRAPGRARRRRSRAPTSHARKASSDHSTIGLPASGTKAFGPPAPSRSPEPAAAMTAVTAAALRRSPWRRSAPPAARRGTPPRPPRPCRART